MQSIIPIQPIPNQTFSCKIPVDSQNITLIFKAMYNELANYWIVDISDNTGKNLIAGLPIVPAQNILEQFSYLKIGSAYIVPRQQLKEQWPSYTTLNSDWYLVWSDTNG